MMAKSPARVMRQAHVSAIIQPMAVSAAGPPRASAPPDVPDDGVPDPCANHLLAALDELCG